MGPDATIVSKAGRSNPALLSRASTSAATSRSVRPSQHEGRYLFRHSGQPPTCLAQRRDLHVVLDGAAALDQPFRRHQRRARVRAREEGSGRRPRAPSRQAIEPRHRHPLAFDPDAKRPARLAGARSPYRRDSTGRRPPRSRLALHRRPRRPRARQSRSENPQPAWHARHPRAAGPPIR